MTIKKKAEKSYNRRGFSNKERFDQNFKLVFKFSIFSVYYARQTTLMKFSTTPRLSTINQFKVFIKIGTKDLYIYLLKTICLIALSLSFFYLLSVPILYYISKTFQADFFIIKILPVFMRALQSWWDMETFWYKRDAFFQPCFQLFVRLDGLNISFWLFLMSKR